MYKRSYISVMRPCWTVYKQSGKKVEIHKGIQPGSVDQRQRSRDVSLLVQFALLLLPRSYLHILYWWHAQSTVHLRDSCQPPCGNWGSTPAFWCWGKTYRRRLGIRANTGRPRKTPRGKGPDKCIQVWISDHSSEKSLRVVTVSDEPFVCQIPSKSRLSVKLCLLEATPAVVCQKQASKQKEYTV